MGATEAHGRGVPDLVVLGAPKCATTAVARWLGAAEDTFLPEAKELRFLDQQWERGRAWYEDQFAAARPDQLRIEATPTYLADEDAPARAAELGLDRFVVILRDPIERAWSHHWFRQAYGPGLTHIARPFEEIVREELDAGAPPGGILTHSRYAHHLERWTTANPGAAVLVVDYRQVSEDPVAAFHRIRDFAGLARIPPPAEVGSAHNEGIRLRWPRLRAVLMRHQLIRRLPGGLGVRLDRLNHLRRPELEIDAELRRELASWFAADFAVIDELARRSPTAGDR